MADVTLLCVYYVRTVHSIQYYIYTTTTTTTSAAVFCVHGYVVCELCERQPAAALAASKKCKKIIKKTRYFNTLVEGGWDKYERGD